MNPLTFALVIMLAASPLDQQDGSPRFTQVTPNTIRLEADAPRPVATLDVLKWLAGGTWRGEGLGGITEETWSSPVAGAMMGMFRVTKPGSGGHEIAFYEFLTFVEQD